MTKTTASSSAPSGGGADDSNLTSFSWRNKNVLSRVRFSKNNTCVYRAFCDMADARVRIMALAGGAKLTTRFSARKLLARERPWARVKNGKRLNFMKHYVENNLFLPMAVSSKNTQVARYKLILSVNEEL